MKKKVLLVYEVDAERERIAEFLTFEGFEVIKSKLGSDVLNSIETQSCDALVCDSNLPIMTAIEFINIAAHKNIINDNSMLLICIEPNDSETTCLTFNQRFHLINKPVARDEILKHLKTDGFA